MLVGVKRLLVCVSGGKDSVAMIKALSETLGDSVELVGFHLNLGIKGYSEASMENAVKAFRESGVRDYVVIDLSRDYGFTIDDVRRVRREVGRPLCSLCGLVKRYIMNKTAIDVSADAIATGHTLDDLLAQIIHYISMGRVREASRLTPVKSGGEMLKKRIKPLAFTQAVESMTYVYVNNLPFQKNPCPYASGALRKKAYIIEGLCEAEDLRPGFKESLYKNLIDLLSASSTEENGYTRCRVCGMPSRSELCGFCRLVKKLEKLGVVK